MSLTPTTERPNLPGAPPPAPTSNWTAGRIVALVVGCILGLMALGLLGAGGWATWATNTQRDAAGYLTTSKHTVSTAGYVITSDDFEITTSVPAAVLGDVRIRARSTVAAPVFVGIAPKSAVDGYLAGVDRKVVSGWYPFTTHDTPAVGAAPATAPVASPIWTARAAGPGTQTVTWRPADGKWTIVVMQPAGRAGLSVVLDMGAQVPDLAWYAAALFAGGVLLLAGGVTLVAVSVVRASRT